jgi:signal transduction histidine kinase
VRGHLVTVVLAALSVVLIIFLVPVLILIRRDADSRVALTAMQQAAVLVPLAHAVPPPNLSTQPEHGFAVSIVTSDGRVLGVPTSPSPSIQTALRSCATSTGRVADGVEVLVPVRTGPGCDSVVRVQASDETTGAESALLTVLSLTLSAAAVLVAVLLAERLARGLLRSVADLAAGADRMAAGDLSARVTPAGPAEIRRVGDQLNHLAIRVDHLLDERSQRSADLTHRLRTPLTALRLDIDAIPDSPATQRLLADYDTLSKAVTEVIRTARRAGEIPSRQRCELTEVARERIAFWDVLAEDTGRRIGQDLPAEPIPVQASRADLEATFDALLSNVFAHTGHGVPLWVTVAAARRGGALVTVDDAGPGFPDLDVVRRGRSSTASTGLGLDIARQTATESGGNLRLGRSPRGGARVQLHLGRPVDDPVPRWSVVSGH